VDATAINDAGAGRSAASITLTDVGKVYPDGTVAVGDFSMEVHAGELAVLIGPSGCGKSTILRMINRLIEPSSGRILVDGRDIGEQDPVDLRRHIGYVIQNVGLFPHQNIRTNVGTVPRLLGWNARQIRDRVDELLDLVGLDPARYGARYPQELSGGQRQRVGVARALAADPPLMLMDEPFGAIDPINRERLQNEFLRLQAEIRKTIVFVTHDIDEAIKMGDRIAIMETGGHLAQYAPPAELLAAPASPFVEDFVGADRALKRLSLQRVRDVDLWRVATVRVGDSVAEARRKVEGADVPTPLLVDERGAPLGWLPERTLAGERVSDERRVDPEPVVELDDVLRDALSDLLGHDSMYAPVVDDQGVVAGVLSIELLAQLTAKAPG
jgi:osmoprotectant transport system ATP-binding protein